MVVSGGHVHFITMPARQNGKCEVACTFDSARKIIRIDVCGDAEGAAEVPMKVTMSWPGDLHVWRCMGLAVRMISGGYMRMADIRKYFKALCTVSGSEEGQLCDENTCGLPDEYLEATEQFFAALVDHTPPEAVRILTEEPRIRSFDDAWKGVVLETNNYADLIELSMVR